mmetsp:Transcript_4003/g.14886  ORF Transcript_4003/g.14886 Transcript_4003/m.14886 type:complete len:243 (-) Transcript_4003:114-842(-)
MPPASPPSLLPSDALPPSTPAASSASLPRPLPPVVPPLRSSPSPSLSLLCTTSAASPSYSPPALSSLSSPSASSSLCADASIDADRPVDATLPRWLGVIGVIGAPGSTQRGTTCAGTRKSTGSSRLSNQCTRFQKIVGHVWRNAGVVTMRAPSRRSAVCTSFSSTHGGRYSQNSGVPGPVEPRQKDAELCTEKRATKRRMAGGAASPAPPAPPHPRLSAGACVVVSTTSASASDLQCGHDVV